MKKLNFLHIGKNAGTQIKLYAESLNAIQSKYLIVTHRHRTFLRDLPDNEAFFFSIRDPITRFYSAFYSRKRKDAPRIYAEHSINEHLAFNEFEHANDLAEALFCDSKESIMAICAIKSIIHTSMNQIDFFSCQGNFFRTRPPFHIIRQEFFDFDIMNFQKKLGIKTSITIPIDRVKSHANDYSNLPLLSDIALKNLTNWYSQDFEFYKACSCWLKDNS